MILLNLSDEIFQIMENLNFFLEDITITGKTTKCLIFEWKMCI